MTFLPPTVWVNDRPLSDFGLALATPRGFMSGPGIQDQLQPVPGRLGHLRVSRESDTGPRRVTLSGFLRADTALAAMALWDQAKLVLADEELELRFAAWPDLVGYGRYESVEWQEAGSQDAYANVVLTFVMPDPLKYAREPDIYVLPGSVETHLTLGSAPSDVHLLITGTGGPNNTVYYRDAQGFIRGDVGFPLELTTGQWIDYDGRWQLGTHVVTDTVGTVLADLAPVGSHLFVADPADGDGVVGPSLEAVNCTAVAYVRKSWL